MAIAYESVATGNGTTNFSYTHTSSGSTKGVLVGILTDNDLSTVTAVTYGGLSLSQVTGSPITSTLPEDAYVGLWFLGDLTGQSGDSVSVTCTANAGETFYAQSVLMTADENVEVVDTDTINAETASPSGTLSLGGVDCFCAEWFNSGRGGASGATPLTDWTARYEDEAPSSSIHCLYTYDTVGSTDVTTGFTHAASDDVALIAVAVREAAAASSGVGRLINGGLVR